MGTITDKRGWRFTYKERRFQTDDSGWPAFLDGVDVLRYKPRRLVPHFYPQPNTRFRHSGIVWTVTNVVYNRAGEPNQGVRYYVCADSTGVIRHFTPEDVQAREWKPRRGRNGLDRD